MHVLKTLSLLGSTGSIGQQTLDIVAHHSDELKVAALAAGSKKMETLVEQIKQFKPELVSVPTDTDAKILSDLLHRNDCSIEIEYGERGLEHVATHPASQTVVTGVVGFLGLKPTIAAIKQGKTIALANKETLVAAGCLVMPLAKQFGAQIVPVDSEHSAIFQSLADMRPRDDRRNQVEKLILTASGGPFRTWTKERIESATIDDALKHPNWSMGPKITIDSATLMNKGLEVIEARWLFDVKAEAIKVVIHPQSILHSAVEFIDGSIVGQMGLPDMRLPIHYALFFPRACCLQPRASDGFGQIGSIDIRRTRRQTIPLPQYCATSSQARRYVTLCAQCCKRSRCRDVLARADQVHRDSGLHSTRCR